MVVHAYNPDAERPEVEDCYIKEVNLVYASRPCLKKPSRSQNSVFTLCLYVPLPSLNLTLCPFALTSLSQLPIGIFLRVCLFL